jgi:multimeric flavodoxin WrbA
MSGESGRRVAVINGGPRKRWNTGQLLEKALEGAISAGAEASMTHLYDLSFKGCVSCFSCKTLSGWESGRCASRDELSPLLESLEGAQAVIVGSPIYLGDVTGATRSFLERWIFINLAYDRGHPSVLAKGPAVGMIYSMNIPESMLGDPLYCALFEGHRQFLSRLNGPAVEQLAACDTLQFDDYSRYHAPAFDPDQKRRGRQERFPRELRKAFEMGARLASL